MEGPPGKLAGSAYGVLIRSALHYHQPHPEITFRTDAILRSVNDRLGALCKFFSRSAPGAEFAPLSSEYLDEMAHFLMAEAEAAETNEDDGGREAYPGI